ncbi:MAG: peptidyl-prolyl cis-trans isomerase [Spirochaetes bacterium]|nr:peptidyl-prolyl cis-trans isomerase [Spirochaetota bacterium]
MKRICSAGVLAIAITVSLAAQTIDTPVATVKLTKVEVISSRQFRNDVDRIEKANGKPMTPAEKRELLEARINDVLFFQMCERERITVSEGEITSQINTMKAQLGQNATDAQFEAALKAQGIQVSDVRTYVKQIMLLNRYLEAKKSDEIKSLKEPSAEEILQTYELYKSKLIRPDTVRMSIIFLDARNQSADERSKSSELMTGIARQVRSDPSRFDEYLLKGAQAGAAYKSTPSMMIGKTPETLKTYGQQFMDIAFRLKAGEISELTENPLGYQIMRVNEIFPQKQLTLTDTIQPGQSATVQDYIRQQLLESKKNALFERLMQELFTALRKEATIKIFEENLKS